MIRRNRKSSQLHCNAEGCDRRHNAKGYCSVHYKRVRRTGSIDLQFVQRYCKIETCGDKYFGLDYCRLHYYSFHRYGDPLVRKIYQKCAIEGCDAHGSKFTFCKKHVWANVTKNAYLKRTYGITIDDYNKLYEEQNERCAICHRKSEEVKSGKGRTLAVDHCHDTGQIRGLLCNDCNRTIGFLGETFDNAGKFIDYLEKHEEISRPL